MNSLEFYRAEPGRIFPDGTEYVHVIKLLKRVPRGELSEHGGYMSNDDGWDFATLLCNSSVSPFGRYSPIIDKELNKYWEQISKEEVLRLEKLEMDKDISTWNHEFFMHEFERVS